MGRGILLSLLDDFQGRRRHVEVCEEGGGGIRLRRRRSMGDPRIHGEAYWQESLVADLVIGWETQMHARLLSS